MIDRSRHNRSATATPLRVGAVSYLNSKPLIEGLASLLPSAQLTLDVPSRLADDLGAGRLDVALIPSIESFADSRYTIVSDACVASRGPVLSVKVYFRRPPGLVRTLAADVGSRTSVALTRVMLEERFGVTPEIEPLPLNADVTSRDAHAVLLIGDRAIHPPQEQFEEVWDLGDEWLRWTGLPFVFAMWVTRCEDLPESVATALSAARDQGLARLAEIAAREAPKLAMTPAAAHDYLAKNLHFRLASAEQSGLRLFRQLAAKHGLIPARQIPRRSRQPELQHAG